MYSHLKSTRLVLALIRFARRPGSVREIPRSRQVHRAGTHRGDASFGSRLISFRVLTRTAVKRTDLVAN